MLNGIISQIWNFINVNAGILQILLTIVGFLVVTRNQLIREHFDTRLNNMKKTVEAISTDRNLFMEQGLALYRKQYEREDECREFAREGGHLIYRNGWVDCKAPDGGYYPLREFCPEIVGHYPSTQYDIPYNAKLPDRKESYAENCKFHLGKNLFDAPLYALKDMKTAPGTRPEITVTAGSYFDFYNTCEYLGFEMAYSRRILGRHELNARNLPVRHRRRELFDTGNRFPGIGINTVTILKNMIDDVDAGGARASFFLLHKRGNLVAEGMGNYHVVPAGSYQPLREYAEREDTDSDHFAETMKNTVLREFGEELLDYEEFLDLNTSDLLQRLDSILEPVFLGLGFEPLNTKTEVLAALFIDLEKEQDASLFGGRTRRSEYEKMLSGNGNYEGDVMLRPLTTAMLTQYENDSRSTASMKEIMRLMNKKENRALFGVRKSASFNYNG
ncbi:MAG: hypothetical protein IKH56_03730 [Oscillospiraceae bacterium]|nr:hypothetical protein [Oscillospiraceae bacterium]